MKVIITGSEGFIGSALSQALQKRGVEVIGIDRKSGIGVPPLAPNQSATDHIYDDIITTGSTEMHRTGLMMISKIQRYKQEQQY